MSSKITLLICLLCVTGCNDSDDKPNQAPTAKIIHPQSALSLESLLITSQISDTENDTMSANWELTSDAGINLRFSDVTEITYDIPLVTTDTQYSISLTVTDSEGNTTSTTSSFIVPAIEIDFVLPFGAISQRYVDVQATLNNIANSEIGFSWQLSGNNNYSLTSISPSRVRFFASKPLTSEYDPSDVRGTEYVRGEGITEEVPIKLSIVHDDTTIDFDTVVNIKPIQDTQAWPEHIINQEVSYSSSITTAFPSDVLLKTQHCVVTDDEEKREFDYNQDGINDYFCSTENALYFYLSEKQDNDTHFIESLISNTPHSQYADLVNFNHGIPKLVLIENLKEIITLDFNLSINHFNRKQVFQLEDNVLQYSFAEVDNKLFLAYSIPNARTSTPIIKVFDFTEISLSPLATLQLDGYSVGMSDLIVTNIDEQGKDEILLQTESLLGLTSSVKKLFVLKAPYIDFIESPFWFTNIYRENIDEDPFLEWLGIKGADIAHNDLKGGFLVHLSLDSNDAVSHEILKNYYTDLFFKFRAISTDLHLNQDELIDNTTSYVTYDTYQYPSDAYITYTLANQKRVLITSQKMDAYYAGQANILGFEDVDNDGDLDIKLGDQNGVAFTWLENINGYPIN